MDRRRQLRIVYPFFPDLIVVDLDDSVYNMTTEQAKNYQAYLAANTKAYSERTLMTREMREAAEREKGSKHVFVLVRHTY